MSRLALPAILALLFQHAFAVAANTPAPDTVVVDPAVESVIKGALKFLAANQDSSGGWSSSPGNRQHPVAMTGYTLMAFLASGNLPEEGEYSKNVASGVQYLLDQIGPDGLYRDPRGNDYMYSHGIATIALSEIYGQTRSPAIRTKLDRVVKVILGAQNPQGGWRYSPRPADADISVTVLQVVALRAAKNAGLDVPQKTIDDAVKYVRSCYEPKQGGFCYQPHQRPGFARTAAAIYSLQVCGQYDDPLVQKGSEYLFAHSTDNEFYSYGRYYAAPAQYMIGGDTWRRWYDQQKQTILADAQHRQFVAGGGKVANAPSTGDQVYWDTKRDRGGVGPIFATAVNTMILAMPYHYIPLYQR
jgi:prenyltransferase/squalene oxidase-like repeat protein